MTKLMVLGFAVLCLSSLASLTMTPPAVSAWETRREMQANTRRESHVIVLDTIEIIGRVPASNPTTDEVVIAELVLATGLDHEYVAAAYNNPRYAEVYVHSDGEGHHTLITIDR